MPLFQAQIPADEPEEPSLARFQQIIDERTGMPEICLHHATWLSLYRANVRMVDRYRVGRVFLAGDAAHVHSTAGGQGMNTGMQDAYNLGWKLCAALSGAPASLLDTYEEERLPVAAWLLGASSKLHRQVTRSNADLHRDGPLREHQFIAQDEHVWNIYGVTSGLLCLIRPDGTWALSPTLESGSRVKDYLRKCTGK